MITLNKTIYIPAKNINKEYISGKTNRKKIYFSNNSSPIGSINYLEKLKTENPKSRYEQQMLLNVEIAHQVEINLSTIKYITPAKYAVLSSSAMAESSLNILREQYSVSNTHNFPAEDLSDKIAQDMYYYDSIEFQFFDSISSSENDVYGFINIKTGENNLFEFLFTLMTNKRLIDISDLVLSYFSIIVSYCRYKENGQKIIFDTLEKLLKNNVTDDPVYINILDGIILLCFNSEASYDSLIKHNPTAFVPLVSFLCQEVQLEYSYHNNIFKINTFSNNYDNEKYKSIFKTKKEYTYYIDDSSYLEKFQEVKNIDNRYYMRAMIDLLWQLILLQLFESKLNAKIIIQQDVSVLQHIDFIDTAKYLFRNFNLELSSENSFIKNISNFISLFETTNSKNVNSEKELDLSLIKYFLFYGDSKDSKRFTKDFSSSDATNKNMLESLVFNSIYGPNTTKEEIDTFYIQIRELSKILSIADGTINFFEYQLFLMHLFYIKRYLINNNIDTYTSNLFFKELFAKWEKSSDEFHKNIIFELNMTHDLINELQFDSDISNSETFLNTSEFYLLYGSATLNSYEFYCIDRVIFENYLIPNVHIFDNNLEKIFYYYNLLHYLFSTSDNEELTTLNNNKFLKLCQKLSIKTLPVNKVYFSLSPKRMSESSELTELVVKNNPNKLNNILKDFQYIGKANSIISEDSKKISTGLIVLNIAVNLGNILIRFFNDYQMTPSFAQHSRRIPFFDRELVERFIRNTNLHELVKEELKNSLTEFSNSLNSSKSGFIKEYSKLIKEIVLSIEKNVEVNFINKLYKDDDSLESGFGYLTDVIEIIVESFCNNKRVIESDMKVDKIFTLSNEVFKRKYKSKNIKIEESDSTSFLWIPYINIIPLLKNSKNEVLNTAVLYLTLL